MKILDGKKVALQKESELSQRIRRFSHSPVLAIIVVGDRSDSKVYVGQKCKAAERIGATVRLFSFPENIPEAKFVAEIDSLNTNSDIHGIIVQLPLPAQLSSRKIIDHISPSKDVDGLTTINQGKLLTGEKAFAPATARGVISLLKAYNISLAGKNVAVLGRSLLVGRPVALLAEREGATITQCHSKTKQLSKITKAADIIISAVGKPKFIKKSFVSKGQVIVDVGISVVEKRGVRKIYGDIDFVNVSKKVKAISPVPGGVGPMTVVSLLENLCDAFEASIS